MDPGGQCSLAVYPTTCFNGHMKVFLKALVLGIGLMHAGAASAERAPLTFSISTEDSSVRDLLMAYAATLRSLQHAGNPMEVFGAEALHRRVNFVFLSGWDAIAEGRIQPPVADVLGQGVAQSLYDNSRPETEDCYLEVFAAEDGWQTVVAVHNARDAEGEQIFQCFTIGLWLQSFGLLDDMPADDWREAFRVLLAGRG